MWHNSLLSMIKLLVFNFNVLIMKTKAKPKTIMLNDFELHILDVLKNTYKLKINSFISRAIINQAKLEIKDLRLSKIKKAPF